MSIVIISITCLLSLKILVTPLHVIYVVLPQTFSVIILCHVNETTVVLGYFLSNTFYLASYMSNMLIDLHVCQTTTIATAYKECIGNPLGKLLQFQIKCS